MSTELSVYVSAAAEMDTECELLGQMLARLPGDIRWEINRTPRPFGERALNLEALRSSHFYILLLGRDIVAPIGVEQRTAAEAGLEPLAFRPAGTPVSPAGAYYVHHTDIEWRLYRAPRDFVAQCERLLIRRLIEGTPGYGLGLGDIEALSVRLAELDEQQDEDGTAEERRGAGEGGVILPR